MKYGGKARILTDCFDKESILPLLVEKYNLTPGEKITYARFLELHQDYLNLELYIFADILENFIRNFRTYQSGSYRKCSYLTK